MTTDREQCQAALAERSPNSGTSRRGEFYSLVDLPVVKLDHYQPGRFLVREGGKVLHCTAACAPLTGRGASSTWR